MTVGAFRSLKTRNCAHLLLSRKLIITISSHPNGHQLHVLKAIKTVLEPVISLRKKRDKYSSDFPKTLAKYVGLQDIYVRAKPNTLCCHGGTVEMHH